MEGKIQTAYAMDDATVHAIEEKFSQRMGAPVRLTQIVDPALKAGFIVTIGYRRFDHSAGALLRDMKRHLLQN